MRILGVDYGQKRVGLAISDETGTIAQSVDYVVGGSDRKVIEEVLRVAKDRAAGKIVVGVPVRMNGTPSPQTGRTLQFVTTLKQSTPLPIEPWDERLTSVQAERVLIEGNVRRKERKEKIDKLAAQLMLQSYLDAINPPPVPE
jgi:putative Holliday junction resolvase